MTRFRTSGTNWEGRKWHLSAGLVTLAKQIESRWPNRHATDGTVASKNHDRVSPRSDHRPNPYRGAGVVRALDAGEVVENDGFDLAEAIRKSRDHRVKYVIHEGRIFSSYDHKDGKPFTWRKYTGSSPHSNHVHISVLPSADLDAKPWAVPDTEDVINPPTTDPKEHTMQITRVTVSEKHNPKHGDVRIAQSLLAGFSPTSPGTIDGVAGPKFAASAKAYQKKEGLTQDGIVGPATWAALEDA